MKPSASVPLDKGNDISNNFKNLTNAFQSNRNMRMKHSDNPESYLASEMELFDKLQKFLKSISIRCQYDIISKLKTMQILIGIIEHPNFGIIS